MHGLEVKLIKTAIKTICTPVTWLGLCNMFPARRLLRVQAWTLLEWDIECINAESMLRLYLYKD